MLILYGILDLRRRILTGIITGTDEGRTVKKDILTALQGNVNAPSRVAGVMYRVGQYVSVVEPELATNFMEQMLAVCADFEQQSETIRKNVSYYASRYNICLLT